jgi:glycosidase
MGDPGACNVEDQRSDHGSVLWFARDLIDLRRRTPDLNAGDYRSLPAPAGVWVWGRGAGIVVALNLSSDAVDVEVPWPRGAVALGTDRSVDGNAVEGGTKLGPFEGAVISRRP